MVPNLVYVGLCVMGLAPWVGIELVCVGAGLIVRSIGGDVRDPKEIIATLPFPVHHSPENVMEMPWLSRLHMVRIQLVDRLDGSSADQLAAEAEAQVDGVRATMLVADGVIVLTSWPRKHNNARALSTLLNTWGRRVHASAGIANVHVTWS
jgi:hypothetical protein